MTIENEYGCIIATKSDMEEKELVIEYVEAKIKRQGVGTRLVNEVIKYAEDNDYEVVTLCACPQDDTIELLPLVKFYEKLGFTIEYDDGSEVLMRYEI